MAHCVAVVVVLAYVAVVLAFVAIFLAFVAVAAVQNKFISNQTLSPPICCNIASISSPFSMPRVSAVASGTSMLPSNKNFVPRRSSDILSQKIVISCK